MSEYGPAYLGIPPRTERANRFQSSTFQNPESPRLNPIAPPPGQLPEAITGAPGSLQWEAYKQMRACANGVNAAWDRYHWEVDFDRSSECIAAAYTTLREAMQLLDEGLERYHLLQLAGRPAPAASVGSGR
jgi:hypothetical protein